MIRRSGERNIERKQMFNGEGQVLLRHLLNGPEEMYNKGRIFAHNCLEPGCEVGWHIHNGDGEAYYILSGEGEYNDNGTIVTLHPGDVAFVEAGEGHALRNNGPENLEIIALVLYK